jgi:MFS family permease
MSDARSGLTSSKRAVLAIILVSYTMIVLDISIVITALPKLQQTLHFSATGLSWVQSAYTLAFGGLLMLGGSLGLGVLVVIAAAAAGSGTLDARALLAHRAAAAFTVGTAMLGLALVAVVALVAQPRRIAEAGRHAEIGKRRAA